MIYPSIITQAPVLRWKSPEVRMVVYFRTMEETCWKGHLVYPMAGELSTLDGRCDFPSDTQCVRDRADTEPPTPGSSTLSESNDHHI